MSANAAKSPLPPQLLQLIERLPEPLRRDPKQTAILSGLLLAFAGVMFFQFGRGGGGGDAEAAEPTSVTVPTVAPAPAAKPMSREERANATTAGRVARWLETPAAPLDRNVFALRLENFQAMPAKPDQAAVERPAMRLADDGLFWDELAKSLGARADQKRQRQIWVDNLAAAAGRITVGTTIMGPTPVAMINKRRSKAGDNVEAPMPGGGGGAGGVVFRIVAIEARRIIVERDGMRFEVWQGGTARAIDAGE